MALPIGRFTARAVGSSMGKDKGGPKLAVYLEIQNEGEHESERVTFIGNLSNEIGFKIAIKALRAMGWEGDNVADFFDCDEGAIMPITPCAVTVECKERIYEAIDDKTGEMRPRTSIDVKVFPLGGSTFEFRDKLDARSAATLGAQLKAKVEGLRVPASKPQAVTENASSASATKPQPQAKPHPNAPGNDPDWMR